MSRGWRKYAKTFGLLPVQSAIRMPLIQIPAQWVCGYIFANPLQRHFIANDVLVIVPLPDRDAGRGAYLIDFFCGLVLEVRHNPAQCRMLRRNRHANWWRMVSLFIRLASGMVRLVRLATGQKNNPVHMI